MYDDEAKAEILFITPELYSNCLAVGQIIQFQEGKIVHGFATITKINNKILEKYPYANIVDEICNSTRIRQQNILDKRIDSEGVIVVGDKNSNNAKSLYKICLQQGYNTIFVRNFNDIDEHWICNKKSVSIVSGASTPTSVVMVIYQKLKNINKN